jgi:hypothetical protein
LVNEIKRTKKSKSSRSKPLHIHVEPRSTSPGIPSYSDDAASSSVADSDAVACPGKRRVSGTDYEWLAAEFAVLKRQNESLERKLDRITTMFEITLRISEHREHEHPGEKRRRKVASDFQYNTKEEEKISDTDTHHMEVIEPVPYHDAARKGNVSDNEMGDSLTAFIDIMLKNEDRSQALEHDVRVASSENTDDECGVARASATSNNNASYITDLDNHYEDELMEEALNANLPDSTLNTDGDLFCSDENEPSMRDSSEQDIITITNAAQDKADGPEPVEVISSPNVPSYEVVGDIEEANVPIGVHVISAHAQLVEEDDRNEERRLTNWHTGLFSEDRRHKKRVICLLGFLVFAVIAIVVVFPTVTITQRKRKQENLKGKTVIIKPCGEGKDRHDCFPDRPHLRPNDGSHDEHEEYNDDGYFDYPKKDEDEDTESSLSPMTNGYHSSKPQLARHSVRYRDNLSDDKIISVTVDGTSYECSNPLFM